MDATNEKEPGVDSVVSVRELVRRRLKVEADPWSLALVQRHEVWDQVRMRHLLDSLLAGYPIGSLLLCRVAEDSQVIVREEGNRHVAKADPRAWQLLDGQQRINAVFSMLTNEGDYGRFLLNMTLSRQPPGPTKSRSSKDRALGYIVWQHEDDGPAAETPVSRGRHIDLTKWYGWAEAATDKVPQAIKGLESDPSCAGSILREIDDQFADDLVGEGGSIAASRLLRLLKVWDRPSIPVLRVEVEDPLDVLEVFTRINLGGVQVSSTDVYFAAVKTFWPEAEVCLDRVTEACELLDRVGALRVVSRLASRGLREGDVLPVSVDRLAGGRGQQLIRAMSEITDKTSPVLARLRSFSRYFLANSELGAGLHHVNQRLWDEVLAWAAASTESDTDRWEESRPLIDAYLLGATLFRYPNVLGSKYSRIAFLAAAAVGVRGGPFPLG